MDNNKILLRNKMFNLFLYKDWYKDREFYSILVVIYVVIMKVYFWEYVWKFFSESLMMDFYL